jgi:hypothetical protein
VTIFFGKRKKSNVFKFRYYELWYILMLANNKRRPMRGRAAHMLESPRANKGSWRKQSLFSRKAGTRVVLSVAQVQGLAHRLLKFKYLAARNKMAKLLPINAAIYPDPSTYSRIRSPEAGRTRRQPCTHSTCTHWLRCQVGIRAHHG